MCKKLRYFSIILALVTFPTCIAANSGSSTDRLMSMALQGDLSTAESLFDERFMENPTPAEADLAKRYRARFVDLDEDFSPGTGDAFADSVILIYRRYWVHTLTRRLGPQEGGDLLEHSLDALLRDENELTQEGTAASSVYERMGHVLKQRGFYFLETYAPPLRDLFLWQKEENIRYRVRLTDRSQRVRVTFMSGIYSLGWKEFATLGLVSTTGWVEGTRLFCVDESYDRSTENFRVSYLKHESRHLADFERFPGLSSSELEYRAKLTELAFASTSLKSLLEDFTSKSAPNPDSPHALANYRVTRDMYQALYGTTLPGSGNPWSSVDTRAANRTARDLLRKNTDELIKTVP